MTVSFKQKDPVYIVGLDLSKGSSGVVIIDATNQKPLESLSVSSNKVGIAAALDIASKIDKVLDKYRPYIKTCVVEDYVVSLGNATITLISVSNMVRAMLHRTGLCYITITPPNLKQFVLGKGVGKKEKILLECYKLWGLSFNTNDEADAFALAKIGCYLCGYTKDVPVTHLSWIPKFVKSFNKQDLKDLWPDKWEYLNSRVVNVSNLLK